MNPPPPAPPSIVVTSPVAVAEPTYDPRLQQIGPRVKSKLIAWLGRVQKEQRVNGDKRIQNRCCEDFRLLSGKVDNLSHRFEEFMRAIRPIGSSSGLLSTSNKLRQDINDVLKEFGSNSAETWREFSLEVGSNELPIGLQGSPALKSASLLLPQAMCVLSERLGSLHDGLCDIPEFYGQRLKDALGEFQEWLRYRAECIESHRDSRLVRPSTTRQYIGQVMKEMIQYVSHVEHQYGILL